MQGHQAGTAASAPAFNGGLCVSGWGDPRQLSGRDFWRLLQVTSVWLGNCSVYLPLLGGRKEKP